MLVQNDRKRQRVEKKSSKNWAKRLVNPKTLKFLLKVGPQIARALYWMYRLFELMRF